jgi:hypothetical protein
VSPRSLGAGRPGQPNEDKELKQSKPKPESAAISLRMAVYGFVALSAVLAGLASFAFVQEQKAAYQSAALDLAVRVRLRGIENDLARSLDQDWRQFRALARRIGADPAADQQALYDLMAGDGLRIAWIGRADGDGRVAVASGGRMEGESVADLSWFQRGLEKDHAGLLEAEARPDDLSEGGNPGTRRYLALATPVTAPDGAVAGTIGALIDISTIAALLAESAAALNLDVYLVGQDGAVITATDTGTEGQIDLASLRIATTGIEGSQLEVWPDGKSYATSVIPQVAHGDLPPLGWRLIGRIDPKEFFEADTALFWSTMKMAAVLALIVVMLSVLFVQIFVVPFQTLARNADRIAKGADEYPYEGRQTSEIAMLSAALAQLKGRRD